MPDRAYHRDSLAPRLYGLNNAQRWAQGGGEMRTLMTMAAAIVTGMTLVALGGGAFAQTGSATATQADFDFCNREAQLMTSSSTSTGGSASPGSGSAGSTASSSIGAGAATGGTTSG